MPDYTKEEMEKLIAKLPAELKEVLFSQKTNLAVLNICRQNGIEDAFLDLFKYTGHVLIGVLEPTRFQETIERQLGLGKKMVQRVAQDIFHLIFWPVKEDLEELYGREMVFPALVSPPTPPPEISRPEAPPPPEAPPSEIIPPEIPPEEKPRRDIYREPIE